MPSKARTSPASRSASARPRRREPDLVRRICGWFASSARTLPWRAVDPQTGRRDPYASLVSEFMLQQTQVSRVLEKFQGFLALFPTVHALASAEEGQVLAAWSGLGYYRRARSLHAAAKAVVAGFDGSLPDEPAQLLALPGIGRYTAGAIASMVFGRPEPLVDGNVARVLLRVEGRELDAAPGLRWAWTRAAELIVHSVGGGSGVSPGLLNEGLMELGATVCTPASPRCHECPIATLCEARRRGLQAQIPRPKARPRRRPLIHSSIIVRDESGRLLLERRPDTGLWAGMWQAPTLESAVLPPRTKLAAWIGARKLRKLGGFVHHTTHRHVHFTVWDGGVVGEQAPGGPERRWITSAHDLPMGNAQRRVLSMAMPASALA